MYVTYDIIDIFFVYRYLRKARFDECLTQVVERGVVDIEGYYFVAWHDTLTKFYRRKVESIFEYFYLVIKTLSRRLSDDCLEQEIEVDSVESIGVVFNFYIGTKEM